MSSKLSFDAERMISAIMPNQYGRLWFTRPIRRKTHDFSGRSDLAKEVQQDNGIRLLWSRQLVDWYPWFRGYDGDHVDLTILGIHYLFSNGYNGSEMVLNLTDRGVNLESTILRCGLMPRTWKWEKWKCKMQNKRGQVPRRGKQNKESAQRRRSPKELQQFGPVEHFHISRSVTITLGNGRIELGKLKSVRAYMFSVEEPNGRELIINKGAIVMENVL